MKRLGVLSIFKSTRLWSFVLVGGFLWAGYVLANRFVPSQHLPWRQVDLNADIGLATKTQLFKLSLSPRKQCTALMETTARKTVYETLPEKTADRGCGWQVALEATQSNGVSFRPADMTALCPMSAASYIWLREVDKFAEDIFGSGLKRIHHFGTYSCRNIAGTNRLSEHAFANAWDVSGFELRDGRLISVLKDWDGAPARRKFLRAARRSGCDLFRVVLTPDYNAAHKDHFHLDMGPSTSCR